MIDRLNLTALVHVWRVKLKCISMECDRRIVIYCVWFLVSASISAGESLDKNVSTASVKLDWIPKFYDKMPVNWRMFASSDVTQNYTNCSGLKVNLVDFFLDVFNSNLIVFRENKNGFFFNFFCRF